MMTDAQIQIWNGDCLELLPLIPNGSIDLVLTDLPYNITKANWDIMIPFEAMWEQVWRVLKPNGAAVFTATQPFTSALVMSQKNYWREEWIWEKDNATGFLNAPTHPLRAHETAQVFYHKTPTFNKQETEGEPYSSKCNGKVVDSVIYGQGIPDVDKDNKGTRHPRTVIFFPTCRDSLVKHPTKKPVDLMEYFILTYTNEGESVLDITCGSGTTGVACIKTKRRFIGIEKDDAIFKDAEARLARPTAVNLF